MKTTFDVLNILYGILNVAGITSLLNGGRIFRYKRAINRTPGVVDIALIPLTNPKTIAVQRQPVVNVNIYAANLREGIPDEAKMKTVAEAVITELEGYSSGSTYFALDIGDDTIFPDDDPKYSYLNLRLNCVIEN